MGTSFSLGPFLVPAVVVAAFAAILVGYVVLFLLRQRMEVGTQAVVDTIGTAGLLAFLVWKLWPLIRWWEEIIRAPVILLRMPGGRGGFLAGMAVALTYGAYKIVRDRRLLLPSLIAVFSAGTAFLFSLAVIDVAAEQSDYVTAPFAGGPSVSAFSASAELGDTPLLSPSNPTVLTFWATWCGPCRAELPAKKRFYAEHKDSIHFVAINMTRTETSEEDVRQYVVSHDIRYPVVLDRSGALSSQFQIRGTPTTIVLLPSGEVTARWTGPSSMSRLEGSLP